MKLNEAFPTVYQVKSWTVKHRSRIVIGLLVLLWMWLVWPTPWRYFKDGHINYRVNRVTGGTQRLHSHGWK